MQRMRNIALTGFVLIFGLAAPQASASLLRPDAGRAYPDIAADINGKVQYTYDATTEIGVFHMKNTPYLIAAGPSDDQLFNINPNGEDGIRSQELRLSLDKNGNFLSDGEGFFELHGSVTAAGQTFSGLLLKGTPKAFGSHDLGPNVAGSDVFDVELDITDGALSNFFGSEAYLRITPELLSTFRGKFDEDFSAVKATSNTRSYNAPEPFPIPEPTTFAVLAAGALGLLYRRRRMAALAR